MKMDTSNARDIESLVDSFCMRASSDDLLGPIFHKLSESPIYRQTLYAYWMEALLGDLSDPLNEGFPRHIERMFMPQHFIRWLTIFLDTIDTHYSGHNAERAKTMVIRKCEEFQTRMEMHRF